MYKKLCEIGNYSGRFIYVLADSDWDENCFCIMFIDENYTEEEECEKNSYSTFTRSRDMVCNRVEKIIKKMHKRNMKSYEGARSWYGEFVSMPECLTWEPNEDKASQIGDIFLENQDLECEFMVGLDQKFSEYLKEVRKYLHITLNDFWKQEKM